MWYVHGVLSTQVEPFLKLSFWVLFYCIFLKEGICFIFCDWSHCQSLKKSLLHNIFMSKYLIDCLQICGPLVQSFISQLSFFMNIPSPCSLQIKYLSCYSIIFFYRHQSLPIHEIHLTHIHQLNRLHSIKIRNPRKKRK